MRGLFLSISEASKSRAGPGFILFNGIPVLVFVAAKSQKAGPVISAVADIAKIHIFKGFC